MSSSIPGIGRHQDDAGGSLTLIRREYAPSLVACIVASPPPRRIYLAEHVGPGDVARVLRHLEFAHAPTLGADACYAPSCSFAALLESPEADLTPAIASSA